MILMTHDTHKSHDLHVVIYSLAEHRYEFHESMEWRVTLAGRSAFTSQCRVAVSYSLLVSSQVCDGVKCSLWHGPGRRPTGGWWRWKQRENEGILESDGSLAVLDQ